MASKEKPRGLEARLLDRFMRSPHAEFIYPAIAACVTLVTLLIQSDAGFNVRQGFLNLKTNGLVLLIPTGIFAAGAWWTAHTWKQLWRRGRGPWERLVYDYGVRTFGFGTSISLIVIATWLGWTLDSSVPFGPLSMAAALAAIFFGVPICLHGGYFWGRTFAAVVGIERDPRLEKGEPPHLA